jgi:RNA polymerase sigma factor (sigma-70 family)
MHNMSPDPFASLPDPELIEACLNGKNRAWETLLVRYQRLIYSIPLRYGLPEHDANDIFQDVSLLLLETLPRLRDRQRLGAWLAITTRRECWRMLHNRRRSASEPGPLPLDDQIPSPSYAEEDFLALERQSVLRAAISRLDIPCRDLLSLLFYSEPRLSYTEIAHQLTIPTGSIGPTRTRCLEKLMKLLEGLGFSEM